MNEYINVLGKIVAYSLKFRTPFRNIKIFTVKFIQNTFERSLKYPKLLA
jgi:hypothetical protein